jgi:transposase-like protein
VRNGIRSKIALTGGSGQVGIEVPRDQNGPFEPQIVRTRQRRLSGSMRWWAYSANPGAV